MPLAKSNIEVADAVLSIVKAIMPEDLTLYYEPYQNGREHGWTLSQFLGKKVAFSEFRRSDDIVVYCGTYVDFSMQGNTPNDKTYGDAYFFRYNEYYKCAEFILEYLTKE